MTSPVDSLSKSLALALLLGGLASCASYNVRTAHAQQDFRAGDFAGAIAEFSKTKVTGSEFLSGAEAGVAAMTAGDWDGAVQHLTRAADAARDIEDTALLDPGSVGEELISWVLNDTFSSYYGEGYERACLHACLGLAYLGQGNVEGLLVEVRRANKLLAAEESLYDTSYQAGGLAHFLSAVGYELLGEPDNAYIDYRALEAKDVGGALVGKSLLRIADQLHRTEDLPAWRARWGEPPTYPEGACPIILIGGVGMGPHKEEFRLEIPTGKGLLVWAVPTFVHETPYVTGLRLRAGDVVVDSVVLEDVGSVAEQNLDDRIAYLAAKSAVRAVMKKELARELGREHEAIGWIAGTLFALATERADLRAWSTLPSQWHAARAYVAPGEVEITLDARGGEHLSLGRYALEPGETVFVLARTIGTRLHAHVLGGELLADPNALPEFSGEGYDQPTLPE